MTAVKVRQEGFTELSEGGPSPIAEFDTRMPLRLGIKITN